jgi:hypothetical protein
MGFFWKIQNEPSFSVFGLCFGHRVSRLRRSRADVLFSNFGAGLSYNTAVGNSVGNAFDGNNYAEGDTFTLGETATLSSITVALNI